VQNSKKEERITLQDIRRKKIFHKTKKKSGKEPFDEGEGSVGKRRILKNI